MGDGETTTTLKWNKDVLDFPICRAIGVDGKVSDKELTQSTFTSSFDRLLTLGNSVSIASSFHQIRRYLSIVSPRVLNTQRNPPTKARTRGCHRRLIQRRRLRSQLHQAVKSSSMMSSPVAWSSRPPQLLPPPAIKANRPAKTQLCIRAYVATCKDDPKLVSAHEAVLPRELRLEPVCNMGKGGADDSEDVRHQRDRLVWEGLRRTEKAAAKMDNIHEGMRVVSLVKELIGTAAKHALEAAAVWAGICLLLGVGVPTSSLGIHGSGYRPLCCLHLYSLANTLGRSAWLLASYLLEGRPAAVCNPPLQRRLSYSLFAQTASSRTSPCRLTTSQSRVGGFLSLTTPPSPPNHVQPARGCCIQAPTASQPPNRRV